MCHVVINASLEEMATNPIKRIPNIASELKSRRKSADDHPQTFPSGYIILYKCFEAHVAPGTSGTYHRLLIELSKTFHVIHVLTNAHIKYIGKKHEKTHMGEFHGG